MRYSVFAVFAAALTLACVDEQESVLDPSTVADGEVVLVSNDYLALIAEAHVAGVQKVRLVLEGVEIDLASYQGSVQFDAGEMQLVEVAVPTTDYHIYNDADRKSGLARFGGFAAEGFSGPVVISLSFESNRPIGVGDIDVELDVLGTSAGEEIIRESESQGSGQRQEAQR